MAIACFSNASMRKRMQNAYECRIGGPELLSIECHKMFRISYLVAC